MYEHAHGTGDWEVQQGVQRPTIAEGKTAYLGMECKKKAERGGGSKKGSKGEEGVHKTVDLVNRLIQT